MYKREKESERDTLYNKNMEDPLSSLNTASHHFDNGQIKVKKKDNMKMHLFIFYFTIGCILLVSKHSTKCHSTIFRCKICPLL